MQTTEYTECRKCSAELTEENIKEPLWFPPYCPACWPSECPHCGETVFSWSEVKDQPVCDSGCYINGAELFE